MYASYTTPLILSFPPCVFEGQLAWLVCWLHSFEIPWNLYVNMFVFGDGVLQTSIQVGEITSA